MPTFHLNRQLRGIGVGLAAPIVGPDAAQSGVQGVRILNLGMAEPLQCLDLFLRGVKPAAVAHHMQRQVGSIRQELLLMADPQRLRARRRHPRSGCITVEQGGHHFGRVSDGEQQAQRLMQLIGHLAPQGQQQ